MEETPQIEVRSDPTLFRAAQQLAPQASDARILQEVYEDAKTYQMGGQDVNKKLVDFVEQWNELTGTPFSTDYFEAQEVLPVMRKELNQIDRYVISKLKEAHQKTTLEAYQLFTKKLEKALGLTEHSETMHRITEILKFIENSK